MIAIPGLEGPENPEYALGKGGQILTTYSLSKIDHPRSELSACY